MNRAEAPAEARVQRLRSHHAILGSLARLGSEDLPPNAFLQRLTEEVGRAVEIDRVKLLRYRPEHADLFCEAGIGWREGVVGATSFAADFGAAAGRAFRTGQTVAVDDLPHSEFRTDAVLIEHGIVSVVNVPIMIDGGAWGVLEGDSASPRRFDDDTVEFLQAAAALTGLFIRKQQAQAEHARALGALAAEAQAMELAIREHQHRVKNNFQIILSIMAMQRPRFPSEEARRLLDSIIERILAVSLAHDQLSPTRKGEIVSMPAYLSALTGAVQRPGDKVAIRLHVDDIAVTIEDAVPIGLIINELVTNSLKYAFGPEGGSIEVLLAMNRPEGRALLKVADNGRGFPEAAQEGTGSRLLTSLVSQLRGSMRRSEGDPGAVVEIDFPCPRIWPNRAGP